MEEVTASVTQPSITLRGIWDKKGKVCLLVGEVGFWVERGYYHEDVLT